MPNRKLANEWLSFAIKNLETAKLLNREKHYTDVIAIDIQQSMEKAFKAIYALNGDKIPRIHSLEILFHYVTKWVKLENVTIKDILVVDDYYHTERYPGPKYYSPEREEVTEYIQMGIVKKVCLSSFFSDMMGGKSEWEEAT